MGFGGADSAQARAAVATIPYQTRGSEIGSASPDYYPSNLVLMTLRLVRRQGHTLKGPTFLHRFKVPLVAAG
jgi:hypothetical protein